MLQFTGQRLNDPRVLETAAKVGYRVDPENDYPANYSGHIRAVLRDGRVVEKRQPTLRGGVRQPMPRGELVAKYRSNARFGDWPADAAEPLLQAVLGFAETKDVAEIGEILAGGQESGKRERTAR